MARRLASATCGELTAGSRRARFAMSSRRADDVAARDAQRYPLPRSLRAAWPLRRRPIISGTLAAGLGRRGFCPGRHCNRPPPPPLRPNDGRPVVLAAVLARVVVAAAAPRCCRSRRRCRRCCSRGRRTCRACRRREKCLRRRPGRVPMPACDNVGEGARGSGYAGGRRVSDRARSRSLARALARARSIPSVQRA